MRRFALLAPLGVVLVLLLAAAGAGAAERCAAERPTLNGPADQARAATLFFMPGPLRTPEPVMTAQIELLPGFATGLFSPTLGRYSPAQMMLDISQGARVAGSHYRPVFAPSPGIAVDPAADDLQSGSYLQWPGLVRRAERAPGEIVPGLLACSLQRAGLRSRWVSSAGSATLTGMAAAGLRGRVDQLQVVPGRSLAEAVVAAQRESELLNVTLPAGSDGLAVVRRAAAAAPERLIVLVQTPPDPARTRLLSIGLRGIGGEGGISSKTTRRDGLVAATDIAPTILTRLGVTVPAQMQGRPIAGAAPLSSPQLVEMSARLSLVAGRRTPLARDVVLLGGAVVLLLLLLAAFSGRSVEMRRTLQRLIALAVLWLPLLLLVGAALRPSRAHEADLVVAGSFLLAWLTDRVVPWPRALWVPALGVVLAHGLDFLLLSGQLTGESLLGSNPLYGARFFGIGNELEAVITVSCVLGVGAFLSDSRLQRPARWFALCGVLLALFLGAGRLGADVGGVIFAAAAFGAAAVYVARQRLSVKRLLLLGLAACGGLAVIVLLDSLTGGQSHLTRTVVEAQSFSDLFDVFRRRFAASINGARAGGVWIVMLIALAALVQGWISRERLLARLTLAGEDPQRRRAFRAGLAGAFCGTVIGALANDSGPAILIIGTVYTGMGLLYLRGRPAENARALP